MTIVSIDKLLNTSIKQLIYDDIKNKIDLDSLADKFYRDCYVSVFSQIGLKPIEIVENDDDISIGKAKIIESCLNYRKIYLRTDINDHGFQLIGERLHENEWIPIVNKDTLCISYVDTNHINNQLSVFQHITPLEKLDTVRRTFLQDYICKKIQKFVELVDCTLCRDYSVTIRDVNIDSLLYTHLNYLPVKFQLTSDDYFIRNKINNGPIYDPVKIARGRIME